MAKLRVWNLMTGHEDWQGNWQNIPNSAGGVSVRFDFRNTGDKVIKYATFVFIFVNRVADPVARKNVKFTGPLKPGDTFKGALWENAIYDNTVAAVFLEGVAIEYMDGTTEAITHDNIDFSKPWF